MKTTFIFFIVIITSLKSFGQISFEKGYFIDNNNQRIECLIKNYDWKNNPTEIEFKTSSSSESQKTDIASIKEFAIIGYSKFVRVKTTIDRSTPDISKLSTQSSPEWSEELLLLKVLVEGKASLYTYVEGDLSLFLYSLNDSTVKQLIYKLYLSVDSTFTSANKVCINNKFRQQLWIDMRCPDETMSSLESIQYNTNMLKHYFIKFNQCNGQSYIEYNKNSKAFHLKLTPGINFSALSLTNVANSFRSTDFGNKTNFRIGLEGEYILPFNKNKWGIVFEPTFQYFIATGENSNGGTSINYKSLEFPIGLRHYFFLNNTIKLFVNGFYIPAFSPDFHSIFKSGSTSTTFLEINSRGSFALGGGIGIAKLSAEIRYYSNRQLIREYRAWITNYQRVSLIIGYKIF